MERININYFGEEISKEDRAHIKAQLSFYMGDAPSDASLCSCISKEPEGYACNLRVHSATGHTFIHRESKSLEQLMSFVYDTMKRSFADWHRDPEHFSKSHPLSDTPCRGASHKNLECPLKTFSHQEVGQ